jgi:glycosyltransferase involved in cell wall biosynthesis
VVVDAYDGLLEFLTDEDAERTAAAGLGLPLRELAEALDCQITVLDWSQWLAFEQRPNGFPNWLSRPATQPIKAPGPVRFDPGVHGKRVVCRPIPATDPDFGRPFEDGFSPRTFGLMWNSDPLFLASYRLNLELEAIHRRDPINAVILPMWGGSGYVAQLSRATGCGLAGVPFAVVVTDTSARRQAVNGEGMWTRPAIIRRQMEDLSLALADLTICFGPRAERIAIAGRLPETVGPVAAPRRVRDADLDHIAEQAEAGDSSRPLRFFLHEPQQPASGALVMLDAVQELRRRGVRLKEAFACSGPGMAFAPQSPRQFDDYWSTRGFVRELVAEGYWQWSNGFRPDRNELAVRFYPSSFEHLPDVWSELARGGLPILSPAAAEGLAPGEELPDEALLTGEPTPGLVADHLQRLTTMDPAKLEEARRGICRAVVAAHRGRKRRWLQENLTNAVSDLLSGRNEAPSVARATLLLTDRRRPLREIAGAAVAPKVGTRGSSAAKTLSVVVACYEMGELIVETVDSVWRAQRVPDELILVDDGSHGAPTLNAIRRLEARAEQENLPLRVLRQGNQGLAAARNAGLAAATGTYISFLDGDDLIEPEFYRLALDLLHDQPGLGGVAAWAITFGDHVPDGFWNAPQAELPLILVENTIFVPCMMLTELLRQLGGYDPRQRFNYEDWELSVRLLAGGHPIVTIPRYQQMYRVRSDSLLRTMSWVQNQGMRELMLEHHRDTVARFAVEVAMQIEHKLFMAQEELKREQQRSIGLQQMKSVASRARGAWRSIFFGAPTFSGAESKGEVRRQSI